MATIDENDRFHATAAQWDGYIETRIRRALDDNKADSDDISLIRKFYHLKKSQSIEIGTVYQIINILLTFREYLGVPFKAATIDDFLAAKNKIESAKKPDGSKMYSAGRQRLFIIYAMAFYRWGMFSTQGWSKITEPQLKEFVKPAKAKAKGKKKDDIMTATEIMRLIDAADNSRDRCMMSLQYECALRPVDLGRLKWGDITQVNERESSIVVDNKTDFERHITVALFNGYLNQWKRDAPNASDKDGFVFTTQGYRRGQRGSQMTLKLVEHAVKTAAIRAGIEGRMTTAHTLRHSRITFWLQNSTPIAHICKMAWGVAYSPMIKTYEHLGTDDTAKEQRRLAGIKDNEIVQVGKMELKECPVCGLTSPPGSRGFCPGCGSPLSEKAVAEKNSVLSLIAAHLKNDPEFKKQLAEALLKQ